MMMLASLLLGGVVALLVFYGAYLLSELLSAYLEGRR